MVTFILPHLNREVSSIAILVSFRGKKYRKSTGESVPVKYWSKARKRAKATADFKQGNDINFVLDKWESAALTAVTHFKQYVSPPTAESFFKQVESAYYNKDNSFHSVDEVTFVGYLERIYIPRYQKARNAMTIQKYVTAQNKIVEYEQARKHVLRFADIDISFYNDFREWFYKRGFTDNYFGSIIKVVKQVYREARLADKLHELDGIAHKNFVTVSKNSDNVYLSEEELRCIRTLEITQESVSAKYPTLAHEYIVRKVETLKLVRDRFIIGAYTGLRVSDFGRLDKINIDGDFIRIKTLKKSIDTVIPIHPVIKRIFADGFDPSKNISDQKTNDYIKVIAEMAGIVEPVLLSKHIAGKVVQEQAPKCSLITTHTARRSFATNAYKAGVPTIAIMKITGHTLESTFLKYIKVSAEENAEMLAQHPFFAGSM